MDTSIRVQPERRRGCYRQFGPQYVSRFPSIGSTAHSLDSGQPSPARGDSYDNAFAESVIGLFKTEVIQR